MSKKKTYEEEGQTDENITEKNYRELPRSSLPFRFHFIDLLYDTQNNIRERHPEKRRRRIYPTGAVLAEGSHDRPAVIFSAHKNECVIQKAIWRSLCTELGSSTNYVRLT